MYYLTFAPYWNIWRCFPSYFGYSFLYRSATSLRGSVLTCLTPRLLFSMVVSISKLTRIYWKMNAPILLLEHPEESWHLLEIRTFLWRMSDILSLMNVTKCLNHSVSFYPKTFAQDSCSLHVWLDIDIKLADVSCDLFADMRRDVQEIFKMTPHDKQVMMFSATLSKEIRPVCKKFMQDVMSYDQLFLNLEVFLF